MSRIAFGLYNQQRLGGGPSQRAEPFNPTDPTMYLTDIRIKNIRSIRPGDPVVPPPAGQPALINPLSEDPLRFLQLDLLDTFEFVPIARPGSLAKALSRYSGAVRRAHHQTVWAEMKRQREKIPLLRPRFLAAPEALEW
jgi:hypothetical protein